MDLYTTSFSYSRRSHRVNTPLTNVHPLPGSGSVQNDLPLPNITTATTPPKKPSSSTAPLTAQALEAEWEAVQRICLDITAREGCLVTVSREKVGCNVGSSFANEPEPNASALIETVWNFHLSGGYKSVMAARGSVIRELPRDNRTAIRVARMDMLESPFIAQSPLKPEIQKRLDDIAADSKAHIVVLNMDYSGSPRAGGTVLGCAARPGDDLPKVGSGKVDTQTNGHSSTNGASSSTHSKESSISKASSSGLETERMCELVLTGGVESVEIAKVQLLVMMDEMVRHPL